ncbi:MAG: hypothetical protein A4E56_03121 [Pelotomaculum sp. PtaU1.Bin065]|nr:MAG: hypothetical protein A4E56_03121 [Pelotomaculum sp. PtaU1.Bin065]
MSVIKAANPAAQKPVKKVSFTMTITNVIKPPARDALQIAIITACVQIYFIPVILVGLGGWITPVDKNKGFSLY